MTVSFGVWINPPALDGVSDTGTCLDLSNHHSFNITTDVWLCQWEYILVGVNFKIDRPHCNGVPLEDGVLLLIGYHLGQCYWPISVSLFLWKKHFYQWHHCSFFVLTVATYVTYRTSWSSPCLDGVLIDISNGKGKAIVDVRLDFTFSFKSWQRVLGYVLDAISKASV